MALQKSIELPNTMVGNYIRLESYRWDRETREAVGTFSLYASKAVTQRSNPAPAFCVIAVVKLTGDKFDEYLSNAVLAQPGVSVAGQFYAAVKAEPVMSGGGIMQKDFDLSDAVDV